MRNQSEGLPVTIECHPEKVTPLVSELERFRQQQREFGVCPIERPYDWYHKNAQIYRAIFLGLALIFMGLGAWVVWQQTNWFAMQTFDIALEIKTFLCFLCGGFSISAGALAWKIRAEKEAVYHVYRRYARKLQRLYLSRRATFGLRKWLCAGDEITSLKHAYHEAVEKLHEFRESTLLLMEQVIKAAELDREKRVQLFNEAILELRERLAGVVLKSGLN